MFTLFLWNRSVSSLACGMFAAMVALGWGELRTARTDEPAAGHAVTETETRQTIDVTIGPRELIRPRDEMPFVMDTSLPTLRRDNETWFFYHSVDWGKSIEKYCGTASNPFQTKVWHKNRDELFDLNGWYADIHHAGLWLNNIYRMDDGHLLGVVHIELHHQTPNVNQGEDYAMGVVHSSDGGDRWTYCGEIVRPKNSKGNIGGTPLLAVGDYFHVYFNEHGADGRRLAVARGKMSDVLAAARNHTVTAWHKYRDGSWNEEGLTGLGSSVLPDCEIRGGHPADLHADAAYNRATGMYMITRWCFGAGAGRLYLHMSRDGVQFEPPYLVDEEPGQWMPYSTFIAHEHDQETNDMGTVGAEFYILINHKSAANYGFDTLYRRKITVARK
ncbi:MAG: hypothetical protein ACYC6N_04330 [Pirellulaceae bacterium]